MVPSSEAPPLTNKTISIMKKLYSVLLIVLGLTIAVPRLSANTITVFVDNPANVEIQLNYAYVDIKKGMNPLEYEEWGGSLNINASQGGNIIAIYDNGEDISYGQQYNYFYLNEDYDGKLLIVETASNDELCTDSFTFTIDNPERLSSVSLDGNPYVGFTGSELTANTPYTVKFSEERHTTLTIYSQGAPFYKVLVNGEQMEEGEYGNYSFVPKNGMDVVVTSEYPKEDATLTFTYKNDGEKFVKYVCYVNDFDNPLDVVDGKLTVPLGCQLALMCDDNYKDYTLNEIKLGNSNGYLSSSNYFYVTGNMEILVDVSLSDPLNVKINVDDANAIVAKKGYYDMVNLVDGENNLTFYSTNKELNVVATPGYTITKFVNVTDNGEEDVELLWGGQYSITATDGMNLKIETSKNPTYKVLVNVDDASRVTIKRFYQSTQYREETIELVNGDNEIELSEGYDASRIAIIAADNCHIKEVTVNDEPADVSYSGYYDLSLEQGYEVKVTSEVIDRSDRYVLYVDNLNAKELSTFWWQYNNSKDLDMDVKSGYNLKNFYYADNYHQAYIYYSWDSERTGAVYLNDERQEANYYNYQMNLKDGDVVKVYLDTDNPESYTVKFEITEPENEKVKGTVGWGDIYRDLITEIENPEEEATVLQGTMYQFTVDTEDATEEVNVVVTVNGNAVEPDEEGLYTVSVTSNSTISLEYDMAPYTELYLIGDYNGWEIDTPMTTEDGKNYTAEVKSLPGQFRIVDKEEENWTFGSNGQNVTLNETYRPVNGSRSHMVLEDGAASDISISFNPSNAEMVVSGKSGIIDVYNPEDKEAVYYNLQGVRVNGTPTAGLYIKVSNGTATKVMVNK